MIRPTGEVISFVPDGDGKTSDDRLRRQIYGCMIGVLGFGLLPWLERNVPAAGLVELIAPDEP